MPRRFETIMCALLILALASALPVRAQAPSSAPPTSPPTAAISWRLENPFRFFRSPAHTAHHRQTFLKLSAKLGRAPTISEMERDLALASDGRGWAEPVYANVVQEHCWWRRDVPCEGYAHPKSHRVAVGMVGMAGRCAYLADGVPTGKTGPCSGDTFIDIPYPAGARIMAVRDGQTVGETTIKVRDLLIVSMGDSFASGEGNPDRPVRFTNGRIVNYGGDSHTMEAWELAGYPARVGAQTNQGTSDMRYRASSASWLHRGCHRSLYSQHIRLALHLAISDPSQQRAVTYIGVACTGARTAEGLFVPWSGNETGAPTEWTVSLAQLSGIGRAICRTAPQETRTFAITSGDGGSGAAEPARILVCPREQARPIDLALLSIGGNDIGFSRLVARASLKDDAILDAGASAFASAKPKLTVAEARGLLPGLESNYGQVARALREALHIAEPRRVLLTAYPPLSNDERGQPCRANAPGLDVTSLYGINPDQAIAAERFVADRLTPLMATAARAAGWSFVDGQRLVYKSHGVCAVGGEPGDPAAANLSLPRRRSESPLASMAKGPMAFGDAGAIAGHTVSTGIVSTAAPSWKWAPYEPERWRPYMPRARWFRTPNDAWLTVNLHEATAGNLINLTRLSAYSGAFHPTAQGHAATADAVLERVRALALVE